MQGRGNSLNRFVHENYALLVGITLPLALMLLFFIAGRTATVTVADPQYDVVYATNYYDHPNQIFDLRVTDNKLVINVRPDKNGDYYNMPTIYIFDHKTMTSRRIDIDFKNIVDGKVVDSDLDDLNKKTLSTANESPDGYRFEYNSRSGHGGLAGELFGFGRRYGNTYILKNGPRSISLDADQAVYNGRFLAWAMEPQQ